MNDKNTVGVKSTVGKRLARWKEHVARRVQRRNGGRPKVWAEKPDARIGHLESVYERALCLAG